MALTDQLTILGSNYFHFKGHRNRNQISVFCYLVYFPYCIYRNAERKSNRRSWDQSNISSITGHNQYDVL